MAELDLEYLAKVRRTLPALQHRRLERKRYPENARQSGHRSWVSLVFNGEPQPSMTVVFEELCAAPRRLLLSLRTRCTRDPFPSRSNPVVTLSNRVATPGKGPPASAEDPRCAPRACTSEHERDLSSTTHHEGSTSLTTDTNTRTHRSRSGSVALFKSEFRDLRPGAVRLRHRTPHPKHRGPSREGLPRCGWAPRCDWPRASAPARARESRRHPMRAPGLGLAPAVCASSRCVGTLS